MRLPLFVFLALPLLSAVLTAAELPLGVVEKVEAQQVLVRFDANVHLLPGSMLALYGAGRVEKHPLTKEVIIEARKLQAKAQILAVEDARYRARLTWNEGSPVEAGMDAVPLPNEAAPNARPVLTGTPPQISAQCAATVRVQVPISDPDHDQLVFTWTLTGVPGQAGTISARNTYRPEIDWTAPGQPGNAILSVTARDPLGEELVVQTNLTAVTEDDWRKRELKAFAAFGGEQQPTITRLERDDEGCWWGLDEGSGKIHRRAPGWNGGTDISFAAEQVPRRPLAALCWRKEIYVLDGKKAAVLVYGQDGLLKREIGPCSYPTDLALAQDGTLFVADQDGGGVLVFEASGKFRARIGRAGQGEDIFTGLTRIALGPSGELYCLDIAQKQVQRFDRFQRRLETWTIQADAKNPPVDLAMHSRGLLVLLASGQIQVFDAKGLASESWKGLSEADLVDRAGNANSLFVDAATEVFVTYPDYGYIVRHGADGVITGVRGAALWQLAKFACDGQGRFIGLDTDYGKLSLIDPEGWCGRRFGGMVKAGGPFTRPAGLAVTPDGQALAVLDTSTQNVVRFNLADLKEKPLVFGQPGKNNGQFQGPIDLAMDADGRTYVLDRKQHRVQVFDAKGGYLFAFGRYERGKQPDELSDPSLVAVSPAGDAAYVYDYDYYLVHKYALDQAKQQGVHVNSAGGKGDGAGQFRNVQAMACDRRGLLYLLDISRGDLQVVDFKGSNAVAGTARKAADLGLRRMESMLVAPDGQVYFRAGDTFAGWRW